jgi:hypothetical protein
LIAPAQLQGLTVFSWFLDLLGGDIADYLM